MVWNLAFCSCITLLAWQSFIWFLNRQFGHFCFENLYFCSSSFFILSTLHTDFWFCLNNFPPFSQGILYIPLTLHFHHDFTQKFLLFFYSDICRLLLTYRFLLSTFHSKAWEFISRHDIRSKYFCFNPDFLWIGLYTYFSKWVDLSSLPLFPFFFNRSMKFKWQAASFWSFVAASTFFVFCYVRSDQCRPQAKIFWHFSGWS